MPLNPFDIPDHLLRQVARTMSPNALRRQLNDMTATMDDAELGTRVGPGGPLREHGPEQAIPDTYAHYRSLVPRRYCLLSQPGQSATAA